jgi:glucuronoarabinoxylan endo-1,4-beta-xylanase
MNTMKNSTYKKILAGTVSGIMCLSAMPSGIGAGAADYQDKFKKDGYTFELWNQGGQGNANWTTGNSGLYDCSWSGIQNVLFRAGKRWEEFLDWKSLGTVTVDYDVDYNPSGNSYLCIYGWTKSPNVEYYICDNHHDSWRPPGNGFTKKADVNLDGGTYELYQGEHSGPSIFADWDTFGQYWSIRKREQRRTRGVITVTDHFAAWEEHGMKLGQLYEIALNVEGYGSSGRASVKRNDITIGGEPPTYAPTEPPTEAKPNADGSYFTNDFEGSTDKWSGRGSAKVASSSDIAYSGSSSLEVTGRADNWNGASISLDPAIFVPGKSYSFSAAAYQKSGAATDIKMTLQYSGGTGDVYDEIALVSVPSGTWTDVSNTSYTIPSGATSATLYFEAPDSLTDFYIDHFTAAVSGTPSPISGGSVTPPAPTGVTLGDINGDDVCDAFDVVAGRQAIIKQMAGTSSLKYPNNADVDGSGSYEINDLVLISKYVLGQIKTFPQVAQQPTAAKTNPPVVQPTQPTVTTAAPVVTPGGSGQYANAKEYMAAVKSNFTSNVPGNIGGAADKGSTTKIKYHSKKANRDKPLNVWLPPNYSESKKYPVLYMNHGVGGGEDDMLGKDWAVRQMASALIESGEVQPFIIAFPQMYTDPAAERGSITQEGMDHYDDFVYDLSESIMPYMAEHYSVAEGRENTAIAGFSMGGRESLYCGLMLPDKIGYICASSPAPGIFPCQDSFLNHRGSYNLQGKVMGDSDFKFPSGLEPYILMIGGGTNDFVVGTFPEQYHQKFDKNGVDHYWFSVNGAGHDASVGKPLFYNFMKNLFKA